jgi:hypothetical protein
MKEFTHGFEPSWTTPKGPRIAATESPMPVNRTMIPRQNNPACLRLCARVMPSLFKKKESVMGIIGNTHGVKIAANPNPNATRRNPRSPSSPWDVVAVDGGREADLTPVYSL